MLLAGEDRGARIDIQNSTFKHSHFCKGLISYRKMQDVDFATEPKFFKMAQQLNRTENYTMSDNRTEPFIRIKGSVFENLAYQQKLEVLTNTARTNTTCGNGTESFFTCLFIAYDGKGFVLNARDFPGAIQIESSQVHRNMAYVKDFLIQENLLGSTFITPAQIQFTQWEASKGQLNFKVCDLTSFRGLYLTQYLTDPSTELDDLALASNYEAVSPFVIMLNRGPIIFINNTIQENIGTLGGAVHIFAPDFETGANSTETNTKPYIWFQNNTFSQNTAYFAGNAIYMVHTVLRYTNFRDYRYMCGAGVHLEDNLFLGNSGLQRHNGGATVHRCLVYDDNYKGFVLPQTSSKELQARNKTDADVGNYTVWYDDALTTYDYLYDVFDNSTKYKVLKYATHVKNNVFQNNTAGMKGTAMLASYINALEVEGN